MCTVSSFAFLHCLHGFRGREIYVGMKHVACISVPWLINPLSLIQESGFLHKHQGNWLLCNLLAAGGGLVAKSSMTLATPWTVAYEAPRSMAFPRQEYWSGLPFPSPVHESEKWKLKVKLHSYVQLFATPWTIAHQAPPSMGFSRQEYWSGLPLPSPQGVLRVLQLAKYLIHT